MTQSRCNTPTLTSGQHSDIWHPHFWTQEETLSRVLCSQLLPAQHLIRTLEWQLVSGGAEELFKYHIIYYVSKYTSNLEVQPSNISNNHHNLITYPSTIWINIIWKNYTAHIAQRHLSLMDNIVSSRAEPPWLLRLGSTNHSNRDLGFST